ncbi:hypothetical protein HZA42_04060 [Candidatus Peregrinibacteria bacterium]|nr:hypothetical protein [Candidatus Peregrinibacteria bacterium]
MSLKLIPVEKPANVPSGPGKKQKSFNPGNKIKKNDDGKDHSLKGICLRLIHFINRGSKFTYEQIDDIIISMQHSILRLQKKKQELLRNKKDNR